MQVTKTGTLVYRRLNSAGEEHPLGWIDREGKFEAVQALGATQFPMLALAPDGKRFAYSYALGTGLSIWVRDFNSEQPRRISAEGSWLNDVLVWTRDSQRIAFQSKGAMYWTRGDGGGSPAKLANEGSVRGFFPDGKQLIYTVPGLSTCILGEIQGSVDSPALSAKGDCKSVPSIGNIITTEYELSPDGKWVVYTSFETSVTRVVLADFETGGSRYDVSQGSTSAPHWSPDGKQLFFLDAENRLRVVNIEYQGAALRLSAPQLWSRAIPSINGAYAVEAGGKRVLLRKPDPLLDRAVERAEVVLNFAAEVVRKLGR
jgi:Tol biopolymer transport system component